MRQAVFDVADLVQLFPAAAYGKNAADIRLAVDAVEDMFRLPDLTHVVIVAGDSDYIPLAQRCKRLGRYVVGIGVAGSSSKSLATACDDFVIYDALPGVPVFEPSDSESGQPKRRTTQSKSSEPEPPDSQAAATVLLKRALQIGLEKDDVDWLHHSAVKAQMKRMTRRSRRSRWASGRSATSPAPGPTWWSSTRARRLGWSSCGRPAW